MVVTAPPSPVVTIFLGWNERQPMAPSEPQGLITPGAVNDNEVSFAKAGRYMLVCFFSTRQKNTQHNQIGMYRAVTVR